MPIQVVQVLVGAARNVAGGARIPSYAEITAALQSVNAPALQAWVEDIRTGGQSFGQVPPEVAAGLAPIQLADWGGWVGPPRVTRTNSPLGPVVTTVAAVWQFPDGAATTRRDAMALLQRVMLKNVFDAGVSADAQTTTMAPGWTIAVLMGTNPVLAAYILGGYFLLSDLPPEERWTARTMTYSAAVNGPLTAWASGQMAQTRTRDSAPSTLELDHPDNPYGPTDPNMTPTTLATAMSDLMRGATIGGPNGLLQQTSDVLKWLVYGVLAVGAAYAAYRITRGVQARRAPAPRAVAASSERGLTILP